MKKATVWELILVFFVVLIGYGYFSPNAYSLPNGAAVPTSDWNANSRFDLVKAFVEYGRLDIDRYHRSQDLQTGDESYFNGHFYSDKAIGAALLGIEFYGPLFSISRSLEHDISIAVFEELIAFLAVSLICAFLAPLVYSFVKGISGSAGYALLITLAICLGTPFYFYSTVFYGHSLAGMFLFAAFFLWFHMKNEGRIKPAKTLISAGFLGYAFITEYTTGLIVILIGLYIFYVIWNLKKLLHAPVYIALALGFLAPLSLALLYNQAVFHNPFITGYSYAGLSRFSEMHSIGLLGIGWPDFTVLFYMTFHTTLGVFWQSPVLVLAFIGWVAMGRNSPYRAEALLSFGIILLYYIICSGNVAWWGGNAFTARITIPALPFFAIPLAFLPRKCYIPAIILTLVSVFQMFLVTASAPVYLETIINPISDGKYFGMFKNSIIYDVYFWNFLAGKLNTNRGLELFGLRGWSSLLPLFVAEGVLLAVFNRAANIFRTTPVPPVSKTR